MLAHKELRCIQRVGRWQRDVIFKYRQHPSRPRAKRRALRIAQHEIHRSVALNVSVVRYRDHDGLFTFAGSESKRSEYRRVVGPRPSRAVGGCEIDARFAGKIAEPCRFDANTPVAFPYFVNWRF